MERFDAYIQKEETIEQAVSVTAAMAQAKGALESFVVKLIGEVCEVNNKPGYKAVYFTVKDSKASLPCMMWVNRYQATGVDMQVGMLVELTGRFTLYAAKGRMNFDVFGLSVAGEGNLRLQVANLAKKLQTEGLMSAERKRPLPQCPQVFGLVTSPRGAAVHDVLRTLRRRFPLARVLLAGVPVEGENAAQGLIEGLQMVRNAGAEVILLVRGGGSFEDLMPFNDESLARAIAAIDIPVVTGIGHEPDTSIADMVADVRASTPTAAAETSSPSPDALEGLLDSRQATLYHALCQRIERETVFLDRMAARSIFQDPNTLFSQESQMLDITEEHLFRAIPLSITRDKQQIDRCVDRLLACGNTLLPRFDAALSLKAARLHDLSPLVILSRGYAIAKDDQGKVVKSIASVEKGDPFFVYLSDGRLACRVERKEEIDVVHWEDSNGRKIKSD